MLKKIDQTTAADMLREYFDGGLSSEQRSALMTWLDDNVAALPDQLHADAKVFMIIESAGPTEAELNAPSDLRARVTRAVDKAAGEKRHDSRPRRRLAPILIPIAACAAAIVLIFTVGGNVNTPTETSSSHSMTYASVPRHEASGNNGISSNISNINRFAREATSVNLTDDSDVGAEIAGEAIDLLARNFSMTGNSLSSVNFNLNKVNKKINSILK